MRVQRAIRPRSQYNERGKGEVMIFNMAADVFVKRPFSLCFLSLFLVAFSLLRYQSGLMTSRPQFRPKFCRDCVVVTEGSTKRHRPIVKMVKHGGLCLATSVERLILLRCGDILPNAGPHQESLSCFMQNVRSLKAFQVAEGLSFESKLGVLQDIVYGLDLDVIFLTETWLNESIMDHEILPRAYNICRCDRVGRVGGGVMTAIKSTLSSTLHEVPSEFSSLEIVLLKYQT